MLRTIILTNTLILSGCSTIDVKPQFPPTPAELLIECPSTLKPLPENTVKLSELLLVVNDNYGTYFKCKEKVNSWINWYSEQEKIYKKN